MGNASGRARDELCPVGSASARALGQLCPSPERCAPYPPTYKKRRVPDVPTEGCHTSPPVYFALVVTAQARFVECTTAAVSAPALSSLASCEAQLAELAPRQSPRPDAPVPALPAR